jgi:HPt (histidine-containing phosphotransfer) domain-containing protein
MPRVSHYTAHPDVILVDETALAALLDELYGSQGVIIRFVADFVHDLPERCKQIRQACERHDCERVAELALSIRTSAHMIGAHRLARDAAMLQATANADDCACEPYVRALEATAAETMPHLISIGYRVHTL